MRKPIIFSTVFSLALLLGCGDTDPFSSAAQVDDGAPAAKLTVSRHLAGGLRPGKVIFHAELTGEFVAENSIVPPRPCPEGFVTRTAAVRGSVVPMGEVIGDLFHCSTPGQTYQQGIFVLTDAQGDILHGIYHGRTIHFDPTTLIFTNGGTNTIRGGTGRYEGASGRFAHNGTGAILETGAIVFDLEYDGLIALPSAN
ncbi:MAG: hypothetical protein GKR89_25945 [Candidatus Latescibacteria bacterium]|nr:hypothetical protein [Candidatus Latescibacterota bacterium]